MENSSENPEDLIISALNTSALNERINDVNLMGEFPPKVQKYVKKIRIEYLKLPVLFQEALDKVPYFILVFDRLSKEDQFKDILSENNHRIMKLDIIQRERMVRIIQSIYELFFGSMESIKASTEASQNEITLVRKKKKNKSGGKKKGGKRGPRLKKKAEVKSIVLSRESGLDAEDIPVPSSESILEDDDIPEEYLDIDHGYNRHFMKRIFKQFRDIFSAVLDILELDFYNSHDSVYEGLASMFGKLAEPLDTSDDNVEKMNTLLELIKSVSDPKIDYGAYDEEKEQCIRVKKKRLRKLIGEEDVRLESVMAIDKYFSLMEEFAAMDAEECDETKPCTCPFHSPCPCCCTGCYPTNHKDLVEKNDGEKVNIEQPKKQDCEENLKITEMVEEVRNSPVEHIDDSSTFQLDAGNSKINLCGTRNDYSITDSCSHCSCTCGDSNDLPKVEMPDVFDYEKCAVMFLEGLKTFSIANRKFLIILIQQISNAEQLHNASILSKQKLVEIIMPYCLEILKEMKVNLKLYLVEMIFKMIMSMAIARKYCFRDPEFFPTLAKLLRTTDECKNRDKDQLRTDGAHVLHVALMGSDREIFAKVSKTDIFLGLLDILKIEPNNEKDVQSAEDVFKCFNLFTDHWDLFICDFQNASMNKMINRWRRYALEYAKYLPDFVWMLEMFKKRLTCILQAYRNSKTIMILPPTFDAKILLQHTRIGCSNPKCYVVNYVELTGSKFKKCSRCHLAYYCSRECQLAHRKTHKKYCLVPKWEIKAEETTTDTCTKKKSSALIEKFKAKGDGCKKPSEMDAGNICQQDL